MKLRFLAGKILAFFIILKIGNTLQNKVLDEIKPNRLNSKWWGLPYIGRSYLKEKER